MSAKLDLQTPQAALQQAITYLNAGRLAEARQKADEVLALHPDDALALNVLGSVALHQEGPDRALDLFKRAHARQPRHPLTQFNLGEANRLLESFEAAARHYKKAIKLNPDFAPAYARMGDALRALGRWSEAADAYSKALKKRPDQPSCLSGLAFLALRRGDLAGAARDFEAALKLVPAQDAEARASLWANLGSVRLDSGAALEGIAALTEATRCAPEVADYWRLLAHSLLHIRAVPPGAAFRQTLLALFARHDVNPRALATAAIAAIQHEPAISSLLAELRRDVQHAQAIIERDRPTVDALLRDPLFTALLSNAPIPDIGIEIMLTGIRQSLLLAVTQARGQVPMAPNLAFTCTLARQCFLNEYVYLTTENEERALAALVSQLDREDFGRSADDWARLAVIACYVPLHHTRAAVLDLAAAPDELRGIIREQIEEPRQEQSLTANLETLRPVQDAVSLAVQSQYEENPFPRWTRCQIARPRPLRDAIRAVLPHIADDRIPETDAPHVLVAGCGTGIHTMNVVNSYRNATVLAVDLSRRSLAYGMRKLAEYGVGSVRHVHADILDLENLDQRFDVIESFGVVHHMRDPAQGAKTLANLLKPGGLLLLGLYSAIGRQSVVDARRLIAERGHSPTVQGIRAARRHIMAGAAGPELAPLVSPASDFWTTSDCRDMIFHVEEHRFTLLDVQALFSQLDLDFVGIELRRRADRQRFAAEHPGRDALVSLPVWHDFETRFPDTFGDTYRLWASRKRTGR